MDEVAVSPQARDAILAWYDATGRTLPFRGVRDPYAIWVSEVMAQQTQVARVAPAWSAFLSRFPTIGALADASAADVLRAWRGLGHNRRALHLHRAARAIVDEHGGRLPSDVAALEQLPGVGPYTARAVAALAFGRPVGAVDTNVRRVLLRLTGGRAGRSRRALQSVADAAVPPARPADWTHAVMDLGATVCRAGVPRCAECPAAAWCATSGVAVATRRSVQRGQRQPAFVATARWLRGQIVDRLRDRPPGEWATLSGRIGDHGPEAVQGALAAMEREGLLERHPADPGLARLPSA